MAKPIKTEAVEAVETAPVVETAPIAVEIPLELQALAAAFETTAKDALLKVLRYPNNVVEAFTKGLKLSAKVRASNMGKLINTVRLLADTGELEALYKTACLACKGDVDKGAALLLKCLEARATLESVTGSALLKALPVSAL